MLSGKRLDLLSGMTWFIEIEIYTNSKGLTHKLLVMQKWHQDLGIRGAFFVLTCVKSAFLGMTKNATFLNKMLHFSV